MTDVRQQLSEALDEVERQAIQASYGMSLTRASEWRAEFADEPDPDGGWRKRWAVLIGTQVVARCPEVSSRFSAFISRWDPATVLRLVERDRELLAQLDLALTREAGIGNKDARLQSDRALVEAACIASSVLLLQRLVERAASFWLGTPEVDR